MYVEPFVGAPDSALFDEPVTCRTTALRLAALADYGVLDTPEEEQFDELASFAAEIFGAPIAAITLIDAHRQWFKARIGVDVRETPLDISMCAHGLEEGDLLVVPDASKDARFSSNPLVVGDPGLRFYAGARLVTPSGVPLGMICVVDTEPRNGISEQQSKMLRILARQVVAQFAPARVSGASKAREGRFCW
jgi:GAF domain-containing protein